MLAHSSVTDDFVVLLHAMMSTQPSAVSYLAVMCITQSPHLHFIPCEVNSLSEAGSCLKTCSYARGFLLFRGTFQS